MQVGDTRQKVAGRAPLMTEKIMVRSFSELKRMHYNERKKNKHKTTISTRDHIRASPTSYFQPGIQAKKKKKKSQRTETELLPPNCAMQVPRYLLVTISVNLGSLGFNVDMSLTATSQVGHEVAVAATALVVELAQKLAQTTEAGSFSRMSWRRAGISLLTKSVHCTKKPRKNRSTV
jgi:hypothetical protein